MESNRLTRRIIAHRPLRVVHDDTYLGFDEDDEDWEHVGSCGEIILPLEDSRRSGAGGAYEEFLGIHNSRIFVIILADDEFVEV